MAFHLLYIGFQFSLHNRAVAGLLAATAVARLSTAEGRLGLDDGGDRGGGTLRHVGDVVEGSTASKLVTALSTCCR